MPTKCDGNPADRSADTASSEALYAPPATEIEHGLAQLLAGVLQLDRVCVEAHFFDDLGADSLLMAQFCARVRKQSGLPSIAMKDVYRTPTLRSLGAALAPTGAAAAPTVEPALVAPVVGTVVPAARRPGALAHFLCGTAQTLFLLGGIFLAGTLAIVGFDWVVGGNGILEGYLRLVACLAAATFGSLLLPLAAKWLLIGRFTAGEFPAWGATYFRFWVAKTVLQRNPIVALMVGSPLYPLYLRALGARIGPGTAIFSRQIALCPDLFSVGAGTVIRKGAIAQCYRAHDGMVQLGPVVLGRDVVLGDAAVLDIDTAIGDGGQLGHVSALHRGQRVPAGEFWHGSPAAVGSVDFRLVPPVECPRRRRIGYACFQILGLVFVSLPLAVGVMTVLTIAALWASGLPSNTQGDMSGAPFYGQALLLGTTLMLGSIVIGLTLVLIAPAVLNRWVRPGQVHPLYGTQYALHRAIARLSNIRLFTMLFGDSSAIVYYLQGIGYHLAPVQQTGTNFGSTVTHDNPTMVVVGGGTVVADGLNLLNAELSATSFRIAQTRVGANNFLGNLIQYPAQGRTGDNCLLATKVMVPIDGPIREGVGLLGSPAFEIPRLLARDADLAIADPARLAERLRAKNVHNAGSLALQVVQLCGTGFLTSLCVEAAAGQQDVLGPASYGLSAIVLVVAGIAYLLAVHRAVAHLAGRYPNGCSIYEKGFWRHERYWKLSLPASKLVTGTPLRPWLWRAMGTGMGRRVLDDGFLVVEKSFVAVGDYATLNAGSAVQSHSQEDGAFKSDHSRLGDRVTLGVGAFIHYGVSIDDDAVIAPDSFLMKGEEVPAHAQWGGNPARELAADFFRTPAPRPIAPAECATPDLPAVVGTGAPNRRPARTTSAAVTR